MHPQRSRYSFPAPKIFVKYMTIAVNICAGTKSARVAIDNRSQLASHIST